MQYTANIFHYNNRGFALWVLAEIPAEKVTCIHIDKHTEPEAERDQRNVLGAQL